MLEYLSIEFFGRVAVRTKMTVTEMDKRENQASFKTVTVDVEELLENFGERFAIAKNDGHLSTLEARKQAVEFIRRQYRVTKLIPC